MGIFWAILVFLADKFANRLEINLKIGAIILIANTAIIMGRGSVYNAYSTFVYGIIIMMICKSLVMFNCKYKMFRK